MIGMTKREYIIFSIQKYELVEIKNLFKATFVLFHQQATVQSILIQQVYSYQALIALLS